MFFISYEEKCIKYDKDDLENKLKNKKIELEKIVISLKNNYCITCSREIEPECTLCYDCILKLFQPTQTKEVKRVIKKDKKRRVIID